MFDFIRDHKKIMQILLIILIFPSFVLFGIDGYKRFQNSGDVVATVNGVEITKEEWEQSHKNEVTRMRASMPNIDVAMFDSPAMKYGVLERMVQTRVLESSAKKLNLKVSDQRVALAISGIEGLAGIKKPDGSLDIEKYKQLLASQGMTPEIFENRMRGEVAMRQVVNGVTQSSVTFPAQIDVALDSFYQQREIQIAIFSASDFLAQAKPADEDVSKFFALHKNEYQSAESADIEYVVLSLDAIEKNITLNEADLKAYFLINASTSASDADKQKAREKAQSILDAIKKNPASFADAAKKNSQDPGSAVKGGDLGFFARGAMVKPFEDAAYALKKGDISGLVQSDFGFHIIQLTDIKSATSDFNQARPVLEKELKNQQARKQFAEMAEQFSNLVYEQSDSFKPVVGKLKLDIQTAQNVTKEVKPDPKSPWTNANLLKSLFSADSIKNLRNTEAIEAGPNTLVAARITKHFPAKQIPLEEIKPMIVQAVLVQKALELAKENGKSKLDEWKKAPEAAQLQSPVVLSREQSMNLPGNLVDEAMRASTAKLPILIGVDLGSRGYGIVKVNKVLENNTQTKSAQLRERFVKSWATAENLAYYGYLKELLKASIKEPAPLDSRNMK
ncbi:MAG: SurA N-terminal domain-containing protein [Burkholderiales bacterium]|nr:SurA N-terminal domain-containing protein [Burkholderiales bacterium]